MPERPRFRADEGCDFAFVRALRSSGFDVKAIAEIAPRASDGRVIALAAGESRVLLTEDKDFGRLVYGSAAPSGGVVLIRFPASARAALPQAMLDLVVSQGGRLRGAFAVLQPGRVRIGRPPAE